MNVYILKGFIKHDDPDMLAMTVVLGLQVSR